ncbi:paraquat-inducible protein A [Rhizobium sp. L1K21]|uniref:paraquat-inducible protein A n=1 Tax=Rhizobium sp. L1K21 TaxID=2954933 RepID=UPI00209384A2|nr:paraquat-inducible protein A [Rhizobium sp. L1K21]MCO6185154.1 paraquat-inducible protein A [Rhizobium sp. L1K21]
MNFLLAVLLVFGPFSFALGITLPLVRFEKLYFFSETPSLIDIVRALWAGGNAALATLVVLVSILFPLAKLLTVAIEAGGGALAGHLQRVLPVLAKWSMMDVLLVALAIVAAKTSGFASALTQPGLWFYAGSAVSVSILHALIRRQT